MPFFEYACSSGTRFTLLRSVDDRNLPATCPAGGDAWRVFSVPTIHWAPGTHPVTGISWHELYDESPRELAHKKGIERYDRNMPHKPKPEPVNLRRHLADRTEAEGASERLRPIPVEGEQPYT